MKEFLLVTSACDSLTQSREKRDKTEPVTDGFQPSLRPFASQNTTSMSHVEGREKKSPAAVFKFELKSWYCLPISIPQTCLERTPVVSNTWKFTTCVAFLALCTLTLVIGAIKGPSWCKLFHNYRHRRLHQQEDDDIVSTVFTKVSRSPRNQTFTFKQPNGPTEEEMDGYFEDLPSKREGGGESPKHEEAKNW